MVWFDDMLGAIMQRLEKYNVLNNTVVVFSADHGAIGKGEVYEAGAHIPMMIRYPLIFSPNTVYDEMTSTLDVAPTVLYLAGFDKAATLPMPTVGRDLVSLMSDPKASERILGFSPSVLN